MLIQRVITVYRPELEKLPTDLASALSVEDKRAISQVRESFDALAKRAERSWLREILRRRAPQGETVRKSGGESHA